MQNGETPQRSSAGLVLRLLFLRHVGRRSPAFVLVVYLDDLLARSLVAGLRLCRRDGAALLSLASCHAPNRSAKVRAAAWILGGAFPLSEASLASALSHTGPSAPLVGNVVNALRQVGRRKRLGNHRLDQAGGFQSPGFNQVPRDDNDRNRCG